MSDRALEAIALFAKLARAVEQAQDVLGRYIADHNQGKSRGELAEATCNELLGILDDKQLVVAQRSGAPEPIRVQAITLLKYSPPPAGADIEVSGSWFKMAQNIARWCAEGAEDAEQASDANAANPLLFDAGAEKRGDRSEQTYSGMASMQENEE